MKLSLRWIVLEFLVFSQCVVKELSCFCEEILFLRNLGLFEHLLDLVVVLSHGVPQEMVSISFGTVEVHGTHSSWFSAWQGKF